MNSNCAIEESVVSPENDRTFIKVLNPNPFPIHLSENSVVASIEEAQIIESRPVPKPRTSCAINNPNIDSTMSEQTLNEINFHEHDVDDERRWKILRTKLQNVPDELKPTYVPRVNSNRDCLIPNYK